MTSTFNPDWVVHPGATLDEWMNSEAAGPTPWCDAIEQGISCAWLYSVLSGHGEIDPAGSAQLEGYTGIHAGMWLGLETQFRAGLAMRKKWTP